MSGHRQIGWLAPGLILFMLLGCAIQPIAQEYRQQAAAEDVTFSMVLADPDAYVGNVVLWGGIIIETRNIKNGTDIIVLETPLQGSERPRTRGYSQGRFIAWSSKLLDPEIYQPGRKITVAAVVSGKEARPLGETLYTYPVVAVKQIVLWPPQRRYAYPYYDPFWGPYWGPYWEPYWGWGPDFGYYGGDDERFEREEHEHFGGAESGEHGERGGDRR